MGPACEKAKPDHAASIMSGKNFMILELERVLDIVKCTIINQQTRFASIFILSLNDEMLVHYFAPDE